jgi:hypothetical protein
MTSSIAATAPANSFRRFVARVWNDPDARSVAIGIAGVLLVHVLIWLFAPAVLHTEATLGLARPHASNRQFDIELEPETFAKAPPKPPVPSNFVETNPDAPENTPDNTVNFGARNQQVAQEKPTPNGTSDRPALEGKKDFESNQIVDGRLTDPLENMEIAPAPAAPPTVAVAPAPQAEQNPLTGFDKKQGEDELTYGSNVARIPDGARAIPDKIEGVKNAPMIAGATGMRPVVDPQRPQPRPQLVRQAQTRPAVLADNKFGTTNVGPTAIDARWSNYGAYMQRLIDTVQIQWERIIIDSKIMIRGASVSVKFVLSSDGTIARIVNVESHAPDDAYSLACVSAITDRAPYGPWTADMKAVLGEEQEMTFTFYYQ